MIDNELQHHGVKGQRWGVRRYQNKDGSLTALGERRIAKLDARKKAEELKERRTNRKLSTQKAKQDMKEEALDRKTNRDIAQKNAKNARDIARADAKANRKNSPADDMYDLPDTYDLPNSSNPSQARASAERGKKLMTGVLVAAGAIAAVYAFKKFKANKANKEHAEEVVKKAAEQANAKYFSNASKHLNKLRKKKAASAIKTAKAKMKANNKTARDLRNGLKNFNKKPSSFKDLFKNFNVPIS